jgi:AcrR family transcriptional regulator
MARHRKAAGAYHHGDLRRALLQEAIRCVERHGLAALSLRDLALRLGVSPSAPYHHFADRGALLRELAAQGFAGLEAAMDGELADVGPSPSDRLGALGRAYVRFAIANPGQFQVMFHPEVAALQEASTAKEGRAFKLLEQCVVGCQAAAGRADRDPMPGVVAMWGAAHGIAKLFLEGPLGKMLSRQELERIAANANKILRRALVLPAEDD